MKKIYFFFLLISFFLSSTESIYAQVTGLVFRDVNGNGTRQLAAPAEPGEFNYRINAYNASNVLLATVFTTASGAYSFTAAQIPAGTAVRLEFIDPAGSYPSRRMNANRTNVQFVTGGAAAVNIDYAVTDRRYSSVDANPFIVTNKLTNGDPVGALSAPNAANYNNLYVMRYNLADSGTNAMRAKNRYLGSVFGMAWQKESRLLFLSAYLKRHIGFSNGGIGAIYQTQINIAGAPSVPTLLLNVTALGINVGTNPRSAALPLNATLPNTDPGVFEEVGKRGIGGLEISPDGRSLYLINMLEKKLHRIFVGNPVKTSFTAADVTGNWNIPDPNISGTNWRPMALKMYREKLYIGGVCVKETNNPHNISDTANMRAVVYEFDPATAVFTEVLRFPLSHRRGYINEDYRYELRNNYWCAWQNSGDISLGGSLRSGLHSSYTGANANSIYYPQPMLANIEFDLDGSMIIGLRDRFGDQGGYANYFESGNEVVSGVPVKYTTFSMGEMLRAGKTATGFSLENNATVTSAGISTTTPGLADNNPPLTGSYPLLTGTPWGGNYGPGGKYYYYNQNFTLTGVPAPWNAPAALTFHYSKSTGSLAFLPGSNEILYTALDPTNVANAHGLLKSFNLGANAGNMCGRLMLNNNSSGNPDRMGKAAAWGDLEVLSTAHAVEIGNRVWSDLNSNGRQDANEPGIAAVQVVLRSPSLDNTYGTIDDQTWTTNTDANGNYFFDAANVTHDIRKPGIWAGVGGIISSGILPGYEYKVEIDYTQPALATKWPTLANTVPDNIDNDGTTEATKSVFIINPGGTAAAGSVYENTYDIDFGFANTLILTNGSLTLTATINGNNSLLKWKTNAEPANCSFEPEFSMNGKDFKTTGTSITGSGSSIAEKTYDFVHDISQLNQNGNLYYRIKQNGSNAAVKYSNTVVLAKKYADIKISPNPFIRDISISLYSGIKDKAEVKIMDAAGKLVLQGRYVVEKGYTVLNINMPVHMNKGTYFLKLSFENDKRLYVQKIIKE